MLDFKIYVELDWRCVCFEKVRFDSLFNCSYLVFGVDKDDICLDIDYFIFYYIYFYIKNLWIFCLWYYIESERIIKVWFVVIYFSILVVVFIWDKYIIFFIDKSK